MTKSRETKWEIRYLNEKRIIDVITGRTANEAKKKLFNTAYFTATEVIQ